MVMKEIGQADLGIRTFQLGLGLSGGPTIMGNGLNCTKKT